MPPAGPTVKKIAIFVDVQNIYYTTRQAYGCRAQKLCQNHGIVKNVMSHTL